MEASADEVEALRRSVMFFVLGSELYWCAWAFAQAAISVIEFDYLSYAIKRFDRFLLNKTAFSEQVLQK